MLQRSPSYIHAEPDEDSIAKLLRRFLPEQWAYRLIRWKNIRQEKIEYDMTRKDPEGIKTDMVDAVRKALPEGFDVDSHFTPHYNPWDQRVCFAPNGDIFKAISDGTASVETDEILAFSETGLELASGKELAADVIVTATGLNMIMAGNIALKVDDVKIDLADTWLYKGLMFSRRSQSCDRCRVVNGKLHTKNRTDGRLCLPPAAVQRGNTTKRGDTAVTDAN